MKTHGMCIGAALALAVLVPVLFGAANAAPMPGAPDAAPSARKAGVAPGDLTLLQKLHAANQTEIQMGTMAIDKGKSSAVKAFGKRLVADHVAADKKIDDLLRKRGLDMTALASTTSNDAAHDGMADQTGDNYNQAFAVQMVQDHQKAIELVEGAHKEMADPQLRALLDQLLPTLRAHLATARALAKGQGHS